MNNASIDHYNGRGVEDVNEDDGVWQIVLEGNVRIVNYNADYEMPDPETLVGLKLQSTILSESETVVNFGTDDNPNSTVVHLVPTEYGVADQEQFEGTVRPQVPDETAEAPEEDAERLQEAPEPAEEGSTPDENGEG